LSTSTIEELQKIVADDNRSEEERKQAAELILAMQGQVATAEVQHNSERRSQFTGAQQSLAAALSRGSKAFDIIEGTSGVTATRDKLVTLQVIGLMLDEDGNDGILYAATGWSSQSKQTLADRMADHKSRNECNPQWRLVMQSADRQAEYTKKLAGDLKLPYSEPKPQRRLEDATKMTSQEFAEFAVSFHRKSLQWDLKQYVYDNLNTPAEDFFAAFVKPQKDSEDQEEAVFKNAYAAHLRAFDPDLGEEEARDFLDMLSSMRWLENREKDRSAKRIAERVPVTLELPEPEPETAVEVDPKEKVKSLSSVYDKKLEEIKEQLAALQKTAGN
jgi:hypothetical protein